LFFFRLKKQSKTPRRKCRLAGCCFFFLLFPHLRWFPEISTQRAPTCSLTVRVNSTKGTSQLLRKIPQLLCQTGPFLSVPDFLLLLLTPLLDSISVRESVCSRQVPLFYYALLGERFELSISSFVIIFFPLPLSSPFPLSAFSVPPPLRA